MKMAAPMEDDIYAQQLKEVFDSCDFNEKGYLNRNELIDLSQKLQLGDQVHLLLREILGDEFTDGKVTFPVFREAFVNVLAKAIDTFGDTTEEEQSEWSEYELGEFPSRSNSVLSKNERGNTMDFDEDLDVFKKDYLSKTPPNALPRDSLARKTSTPNDSGKRNSLGKHFNGLRLPSKDERTVEGSGSVQSIPPRSRKRQTETPDQTADANAQQIRKIWDDFAVGQSGFLNLLQLATVCDHIGMEAMAGEELELLFIELDKDQDGLIGFEEFYNGLFTPRNSRASKWNSDNDEDLDSVRSVCSVKSLKEIVRDDGSAPPSPRRKKLNDTKVKPKISSLDIFSSLDPNESGLVDLVKMKKFLSENDLQDLESVVSELPTDADGRVDMKQIASALETTVFESDNTVCKSVLKTYKKEISHLHDQLDSTNNEMSIMKDTVMKLSSDKKKISSEGEEQYRKREQNYQDDAKILTGAFEKKLMTREQELKQEHDAVIRAHENEYRLLERKLDELKKDDGKSKTKLKESALEILRLEENLRETMKQLNEERRKCTKHEEEIEGKESLREKNKELEQRVKSLSNVKEKQKIRIEDLQRENKKLQEDNEEFVIQLESAKEKIKDNFKRNGSYLSDYLKPEIVKRNSRGESVDEVFSSADMDELRLKVFEQETTISGLRRDLETVNKLLEEQTSNASERHRRELDRLTGKYSGEIADLQKLLAVEREEMISHYSNEKNVLIDKYEQKIDELKMNFKNENENMMRNFEYERERWNVSTDGGSDQEFSFKKERRKIESSFREEKEEMELNYRSQITKLEEKVVILETEKAELELKFLNEKAELEQKFRLERSELQQNASTTSREFDKSQKYISFLKDDMEKKHSQDIEEIKRLHNKEKESMLDNMENELEELSRKYQRDLQEVKRNFSQQVSELENGFTLEKASRREGLTREMAEAEQKFLREKKELADLLKQEYEHKLAVQMADLRKTSVEERSSIAEEFSREKHELKRIVEQEKSTADCLLKQQKTDLELAFANERGKMKEDFEMEKSLLERQYQREISELQQAFSGGEAGLKGKMKEDFNGMISKYKKEWENSYVKEKLQLQESYAREKAELELRWQVEKTTMEECYVAEKRDMVAAYSEEKQEMWNRFQKQKQKLEAELAEQCEKLKANRQQEVQGTVDRATQHLTNSVKYFEIEVNALKEQKKELETKNQVLELKILSQKQEAVEIGEFQNEKTRIEQKMKNLLEDINTLKNEKEIAESELKNLCNEKAIILDNSVQEITEQQQKNIRLQHEIEGMRLEIERRVHFESEANQLHYEKAELIRSIEEKDHFLYSLERVDKENAILSEGLRDLERRDNDLQSTLQEKDVHISQIDEECDYYKTKLENLEEVYQNELESRNEKLNVQTAAFTTEKSRYLREIQELKEHLHRASISSDRDSALKEKVFNDAKAEVMNLNRKLEEKSRQIRSLQESLKVFDEKHDMAAQHLQESEDQVQKLKILINENNAQAKDEKREITSKSMRSDTLVTELYLENADLMKQIANAEANQIKAEKQTRQLTDQKQALQRVISKLCRANGITNLS